MIKFKHEGRHVWFDETSAKVVAQSVKYGLTETLYKTRLGKYVLDSPITDSIPGYKILSDVDAAWWLYRHGKEMPWTLEGLINENEV